VLRAKVATMTNRIDDTINTVRRISAELRPRLLDDLGLVAAIEWQAQQFQARTGIICQFDSLVENGDVSQDQATAIFRIFQEAMTNILRHAQATRVNKAPCGRTFQPQPRYQGPARWAVTAYVPRLITSPSS